MRTAVCVMLRAHKSGHGGESAGHAPEAGEGGIGGAAGRIGASARRALGTASRPRLACVALSLALVTALLLHQLYIRQFDPMQCSLAAIVCMDDVFREHGLAYFLDYGSLLGSVRHGGFIPWDGTGDVDVGFDKRIEHDIRALRPVFRERCGMDMIHRNDTWWLPPVTSFVIRRGAFRLFCAPMVPYYVDLADYTVEKAGPREGHASVIVDHHYYPHASVRHAASDVLPVQDCQFEDATLMCPARSEVVLRTIYGPDWRIPDPDYYDKHAH